MYSFCEDIITLLPIVKISTDRGVSVSTFLSAPAAFYNVGKSSGMRDAHFFATKRNSRCRISKRRRGEEKEHVIRVSGSCASTCDEMIRKARTCAPVKRRRGGKFALDIRKRGLSKQNAPGYKGNETRAVCT